jgi:hypothetical protein
MPAAIHYLRATATVLALLFFTGNLATTFIYFQF